MSAPRAALSRRSVPPNHSVRGVIEFNEDALRLNFRLLWALLFVATTLIVGATTWSLAYQHGLPEFAVAVFAFWLAFFAAVTWITLRRRSWSH